MPHRFIFLIGIILFTFSCGKDQGRACSGICTEEFRTIRVSITDAENKPVLLDSISITDLSNNRNLDLNENDFLEEGVYMIFNDNFVQDYKNEESSLLFKGFQEDELVVEETYEVGADCCHVYHISGDLQIQLD